MSRTLFMWCVKTPSGNLIPEYVRKTRKAAINRAAGETGTYDLQALRTNGYTVVRVTVEEVESREGESPA